MDSSFSSIRLLHVSIPSRTPSSSNPAVTDSSSHGIDCYLHLSTYISPFSEPPWLKVQLMKAEGEMGGVATSREVRDVGRIDYTRGLQLPPLAELSCHPPVFTDKLPLRQFFMRRDSGSSASLVDQLIAQGAISMVSPELTLPLDGGRAVAVAVELMLGDAQMMVQLVEEEERKKMADDESRFLAHTYIMHLGI